MEGNITPESQSLPSPLVEIQQIKLKRPREVSEIGRSKEKTFSQEALEYMFWEDANRIIKSPQSISKIPRTLSTMADLLENSNIQGSSYLALFRSVLEELNRQYPAQG